MKTRLLLLILGTISVYLLASDPIAAADMDCRNFTYQEDAQNYFESKGGSRTFNADNLDADGNGLACESLPHRRGTTTGSTLPLPTTPTESNSGISGWWFDFGLGAIGAGVWFYFAEIHGPDNQRAIHPENLPYNTRTMPYELYLKTPEWQSIRKMALDRDGNKCTECGSTHRLQAHHLTYARRGHEKRKDLKTLCNTCHEKTHAKRLSPR